MLLAACEDPSPVGADLGGEVDSGPDGADAVADLPSEDTDPDAVSDASDSGDAAQADVDASGADVTDDPATDSRTDVANDTALADSGDASDAYDSADFGDAIVVSGLLAFENPANVLSAYVEWDTSRDGDSVVEVRCGADDEVVATISDSTPTTSHAVFVMGLLPDLECTFTVSSTDAGRRTASASTSYEVGSLPEALPALTVNVPADPGAEAWDELQPGWTLVPLVNLVDRTSHFAVLFDERGRVRWYRELPGFGLGSDNDVREVPQGVLFGSTAERTANDPVIISWEGETVWTAPVNMHHHISVDPNDGTYLYLGRDWDCPEGPSTRSDTIERWDPVAEETSWVWYSCDHYTPPGGHVHDWDHLNTVEVFPGETTLLASVRNQNQLWRIDVESGDIEWRLGQGGEFAMDEADYFFHQHAPEVQDDGQILLFDNGLAGTRPYSRAIELSYDTEEMTAEVVWEYRHDPDIFSATMGEADRMANGNTLVTFTGRSADQPSVLVEVTTDGSVLWELETAPKWTVYRADRVAARYGYVLDAAEGE